MQINEIVRDFRAKYQGTFVHTENPETGKEILCRIDTIEDTAERNAMLYLTSRDAGTLQLNMASSQVLRFKFPQIGTFQYGRDSFMCTRRTPHRQYSRGLCPTNHDISHAMAILVPGLRSKWNLDLVEAAFNVKKYKVEEAMDLLSKGKIRSAALAGRYTLSLPTTEDIKGFMLIHGFDYLGRVEKDRTFTPYKGLETLTPEVTRLLLEL